MTNRKLLPARMITLLLLTLFAAGCTTSFPGTRNERKNLWALGPLGKYSWGESPGSTYLAPVFYADPSSGLLISPIFAAWRYHERAYKCLLPLLSWYSEGNKDSEVNGLFGLFFEQWRKDSSRQGHLIPLYFHRGTDQVYTPFFGWKRNTSRRFFYVLTPLLGFHHGHYYGGWLLPLFTLRGDSETGHYGGTFLWGRYWKRGEDRLSSLIPLYHYRNRGPLNTPREDMPRHASYGVTFWMFPAAWYKNMLTVEPDYDAFENGERNKRIYRRINESGCFPLWSYIRHRSQEKNIETVKANILWFLYRYRKETGPSGDQPGDTTTYTRSAVLFKVWEREHRKDGSDRLSILHSLFRYDNGRNKKVTLLYCIRF